MKYGLLEYKTENIGDEIQSIAARRFLPSIDYYFDRDNLKNITLTEDVKIILNGWFTHNPENWPPTNPHIKPLAISIYPELYYDKAIEAFSSSESKNFLKRLSPIGARSLSALEFFQKIGIDSYFSGCLTLTINKDKNVKQENFILAVDVDDDILKKIRSRTKRPVYNVGAYHSLNMNRNARFALAEYYLSLYQSAHCVVTTRLHCMLPCLALGTPVLAISGKEPKRFSNLLDLVHSSTKSEFLKPNFTKFNLDHPPQNPKTYLKLRSNLEKTCSTFTGFDSKSSYLTFKNRNELMESSAFREAVFSIIKNGIQSELEIFDLKYSIDALKKANESLQETNNLLNQQLAEKNQQIFNLTNVGVKGRLKDLGVAIKNKLSK